MFEKKYKYKKREELSLRKKIIDSGFINQNILDEIYKEYNKNPYHNFMHALHIGVNFLKLPKGYFKEAEKKSILYAILFHDAGHTGVTKPDDEENSLQICLNFIKKYKTEFSLEDIDENIIREGILGTIFMNRGKSNNKYAQIISDLDIGVIGDGIVEFLYYSSIPLFFELGNGDLKKWFEIDQINYFNYLKSINKEILISTEVKKNLNNSKNTINAYNKINTEIKIEMLKYLKTEDITLKEFKEKFSNM